MQQKLPEYTFTQDWFSWAPPVWEQLIPLLPDNKRFLEIGSFEGRATVWMLENMLDQEHGHVDCIDTWAGGEEHEHGELKAAESLFDRNMLLATKNTQQTWYKMKEQSHIALARLLIKAPRPIYDFIYVDAAHTAKDVLRDGLMAWPLLKDGGIIVFDDYLWGQPRDILHRPKIGVDSFCNVNAEELVFVNLGRQAVCKKEKHGG